MANRISRNVPRFDRKFRKALAAISGFLFLVSVNPAFADGAIGSVPTTSAAAPPPSASQLAPPVVPAAVAAGAAAIQRAGVAAGTTQLDLSSVAKTVPMAQTVVIQTAGATQVLNAGTLVTPAQFLAAQQLIAAGRQSLLVARSGNASGGTFSLNHAASGSLAGIVVPAGVTAIGTNTLAPISGDLVNAGTIYGVATNANNPAATIVANAITNQSTGLITTIVPSSIRSTISGALGGADLVLGAVHDITNFGTITSSGSLTLASTAGAVKNASATSVAQAQNALNIIAGNGVINNAGLIASTAGAVNLGANTNLAVTANGGSFNSSQSINIAAIDKAILLSGGNYRAPNLNINAGNGTIDAAVGEVTGTLSSSANVEHFLASTPTLSLGNNCVTGDPTFANQGNISINGVNTFGENVAILAEGNITADANGKIVAPGFTVSMIAGAKLTPSGGAVLGNHIQNGDATSQDISGGNGAGTPAYSAGPNGAALVTVDFSNPTNGSIDLSGSTQATVIDTSNPFGAGGNVVLASIKGVGNTGYVKTNTTPGLGGINTGGGIARVIANGNDGTGAAIALGDVRTGGFVGGRVELSAQAPTGNGPIVVYNVNGNIDITSPSGVILPGGPVSGRVTFNSINTSGVGGGGILGPNGGSAGDVTINAQTVNGGNIYAFGGGGAGGQSSGGAGGAGGNGGVVSVNLTGAVGSSSTLGTISSAGGGGGGGAGGDATTGFAFPGGPGGPGGTGANVQINTSHALTVGNIYTADGGAGGAGGAGTPNGAGGSGGGGGGSYGGGGGGGGAGTDDTFIVSHGGAGGAGIFGGGGGGGSSSLSVNLGGGGGGALSGGPGGVGSPGNDGSAGTAGVGGDGSLNFFPGGASLGQGGAGAVSGINAAANNGTAFVHKLNPGAATINVGAPGPASIAKSFDIVNVGGGDTNLNGSLTARDSVSIATDLTGNLNITSPSFISTPVLTLTGSAGTFGSPASPVATNAAFITANTGGAGSVFINDNWIGVVEFDGSNQAGNIFGVQASSGIAIAVPPGASISAPDVRLQTPSIFLSGTINGASIAIDNPTFNPLAIVGTGTYNATKALTLSSAGNLDLGLNGVNLFNNIVNGVNVTVVTNNNILATGDGGPRTIFTEAFAGVKGGDVNLLAGTNYTSSTFSGNPLTINAASAQGGSVLLNDATEPVSINTSSVACCPIVGGNVTIVANHGFGPGSGRVLMSANSSIITNGVVLEGVGGGSNGSVTVIAGGTNSTTVQLGTITTADNNGSSSATTGPSGTVSINVANMALLGTPQYDTNGLLVNGAVGFGAITANGGVTTGNVNAFGADVAIRAGGGITTGNITTAGGGGSFQDGGSGGSVFLDTTAGVNSVSTGFIRTFGGGGAGGRLGSLNATNGGAGGNVTIATLGNLTVNGDINSSGGGGGGGDEAGNAAGAGGKGGNVVLQVVGNTTLVGPVLASGGAGGSKGAGGFGGGGGGSFGGGGGGGGSLNPASGGAGGGGFVGGGGADIFGGSGGGIYGPGVNGGGSSTDGQSGAGGNGSGGFDGGLFGRSGEGGSASGLNVPIVGDAGAGTGGTAGGAGSVNVQVGSFNIDNTIQSAGSGGIPGYNFASIGNSGFGDLGLASYGTNLLGQTVTLNTVGLLNLGFGIAAPALPFNLIAGILNISSLIDLLSGSVHITTSSLTNDGSITARTGDVTIDGLMNQGSINPPAVPNLLNSGSIVSLNGDVDIFSSAGENLVVSGGGVIAAAAPGQKVTLTATDNGTNDAANYLIFSGDQNFQNSTFLKASGPKQTLWVQSGADVVGDGPITLDTSNLILDGTVSGAPTVITTSGPGMNITNTTGNLLLPNNFSFEGKNLFLGSVGSIIGSGLTSIDLSNGAGSGGNLTLVAGFNMTNANGEVTIGTPNGGGSIILPGVVIDTSGNGGNAGNVSVFARNGSVELDTVIAHGNGVGNAGGTLLVMSNGAKIGATNVLGNAPVIDGSAIVQSGTTSTTGGVVKFVAGGQTSGVFVNTKDSGNIQFTGNIDAGLLALSTGGTGSITFNSSVAASASADFTAGSGGIASFTTPVDLTTPSLSVNTTGDAFIQNSSSVFAINGATANQLQISATAPDATVNVNGNINSNNLLIETPNFNTLGGTINVNANIAGVNGINGPDAQSLHFITDTFNVNGAATTIKGSLIEVDSAGALTLAVFNAGTLQADLGNIYINSGVAPGSIITVTGGGTMRALAGLTQITLFGNGGAVDFIGNQTFMGDADINATSATGQIRFENGVGVVGTQALNLNTGTLFIGTNVTLQGNPLRFNSPDNLGTIANSNGDVNIPSGLIFHGNSLAIIASGNINSAPGVVIDLSNGAGKAGDLTIYAGYDFTLATGGQVGPDGTVYYIGGPSLSGGSVNMAGTDINLSGTIGGNLVVLAHDGNVNNGSIALGNINTAAATPGTVTLYGRGGITTGDITTSGGMAPAGEVRIVAGTPTITGTVQIWNGVVNPSFVPGLTPPTYSAAIGANSGNILTGSINAPAGVVSLLTSGSGSIKHKNASDVTTADILLAVGGTGGIGTAAAPYATNVARATLDAYNTGSSNHGDVFTTNSTSSLRLENVLVPTFVTYGATLNFINGGNIFDYSMTNPVAGNIQLQNLSVIKATDVRLHASGTGSIDPGFGTLIDTTILTLSSDGGDIGPISQGFIATNAAQLNFNAQATGNVSIATFAPPNLVTIFGANTANNATILTGQSLQFADGATLTATSSVFMQNSLGGDITQAGSNITITTPSLTILGPDAGNIGTAAQPLNIAVGSLATDAFFSPLARLGDVFINNNASNLTLSGGFTRDYTLTCSGCAIIDNGGFNSRNISISTGTTGSITVPVTFGSLSSGTSSFTTGDFTNNGSLVSQNTLTVIASGSLTNNISIDSAGKLTLSAGTTMTLDTLSNTTSSSGVELNANQVIAKGLLQTGTGPGSGNLTVTTTGTGNSINFAAGSITQVDGDLDLTGTTIDNSGNTTATGKATVLSDGVFHNHGGGTFHSDDDMSLTATDVVNNGTLTAGADLTVSALTGNGTVTNTSTMTAGGTFTVNAAGLFDNSGNASAVDALSITSEGISNHPLAVIAGKSVDLDAGAGLLFNDSGLISASNGNLTADADSVINVGIMSASNDVTISSDNLVSNAGLVTALTGNLTVTAGTDVLNTQASATYHGNGTVSISGDNIDNFGTISSGGNMTLSAAGGSVSNEITGVITAGGSLTVVADVLKQLNSLTAGNSLTVNGGVSGLVITPTTTVTLGAGSTTTVSNGAAIISAKNVDGTDATVNVVSGSLAIDGGFNAGVLHAQSIKLLGSLNNTSANAGILLLGDDVQLAGTVNALGAGSDIIVDAPTQLSSSATITADHNFTMTGGALTNSGSINASTNDVSVTATSVDNSGSISALAGGIHISAPIINLTASSVVTAQNEITLDGGATVLGVDGTALTNAGSIASTAGSVNITATTADLSATTSSIDAFDDVVITGPVIGLFPTFATSVTNGGSINAGTLLNVGNVLVVANVINNNGSITASGDVDLVSTTGIGNGDLLNSTASIQSGGNTHLTGDAILNFGDIDATGDLSILGATSVADVAFNSGTISAGNISVFAKSLENAGLGDISTPGYLFITGLDNGIIGSTTATISAGQSLTVTTKGDNDIHILNAQTQGGLSGANVLLLAGGNIFNTTSNTTIDTSTTGAGQNAGSITLIAGVGDNFTATGPDSIDLSEANYPGGFINLGDRANGFVATLNASATGANASGGNVNLIAFGGGTNKGWIGMSPTGPGQASPNLIDTRGTDASGQVTVLAGGTSTAPIEYENLIPITGSAITVGDINTAGTGTANSISISAALRPVFSSTTLSFSNGNFDAGSSITAPDASFDYTSGSIVAGALNTSNGSGADDANATVSIRTNGNVNFGGGSAHNYDLQATNGALTLPTNALTAAADANGDGGSINVVGGSIIFLGGNNLPLTLNANDGGLANPGNAGSVSVVRNSNSLLVIGNAPGDLLINATGAGNGGDITVKNGGQLFVVLTAVPGPSGSGVGLNFLGQDGNGANIHLEAGTMGPGLLTLNGPLDVSATQTVGAGNGGNVTLISNSVTPFNYGNTTKTNTNGIQGSLKVAGIGGGDNGNIFIENKGGGVVYAPSAANVFNAVKDVTLIGLLDGNGNVTASVTAPITATGNITITSNVGGTKGDATVTVTKNLTAGGDIVLGAQTLAGKGTVNVTGALTAANVTANVLAKTIARSSFAAITTSGGEGNVTVQNESQTSGTIKLNGAVNASGTNADVVLTNDVVTTGSITTKAITAGDTIVLLNTTGGAGSITVGGAYNAQGGSVVLQQELTNATGAPAGKVTVSGAITAANNVRIRSIGNGNGSIAINKNVTAGNDVDLISSGKGTITTGAAATVQATAGLLNIDAGKGAVGSAAGLNINATRLQVNALGAVSLNDKLAATGAVTLETNANAGTTFFLTTPGDIIAATAINAPLSVTLKSTGTGNDILLEDVNTNATTVGTTKGGVINLTTTGNGSIASNGVLTAQTVNFTTGSGGNIGGLLLPVVIDAATLTVNSPGNGINTISNVRNSQLTVTKVTHPGAFFLDANGPILFNAAYTTAQQTVGLQTNTPGAGITINGNIGTAATQTISVATDGNGNITGKGKLSALSIGLISTSGNIGGTTAATPLNVSTPNLAVVETGGSGNVNVKNAFTGLSLVDTQAHAGGNFTLQTSGATTLGSITADNGSISVVSKTGELLVLHDSTILANNGGITLQTTGGTIRIGDLDTTSTGPILDNNIQILTTGESGKAVNIVVGAIPTTPVTGPAPANVIVDAIGTGRIFFGKNGINVTGQTDATHPVIASFTAINTNLVFSTGTKPNTAIRVNQGVRVEADPPAPAAAPMTLNLPVVKTHPIHNVATPIEVKPAGESASSLSSPSVSMNFNPFANIAASTLAQVSAQAMSARSADDFINDTELMNGEIPATLVSDEGVKVQTRVAGNGTLTGGVLKNIGKPCKDVSLERGSAVFAPTVDTVVHTNFGNVTIAANSVVLVLSFNGGIGVYNLHDTKRDAVVVQAGARSIKAAPGTTVVLSTSSAGFDQVNPAQLFLYRNIQEHQVAPAMKAFVGEFSPLSAINTVLPLKQLCTSKQSQARRLSESLMKTAAAIYQVRAAGGRYQQILHPSVAAWQH